MFHSFLLIVVLLPIIGFAIISTVPYRNERWLSSISFGVMLAHFISTTAFIIAWLAEGAPTFNLAELTVVKTPSYLFFIDLYFDKISVVFLFIGSLLTSMVTTYSKYYLHREKGYKRFFMTVLFFFFGYNIVILAGNFETLFVGWEVIGISSFLLIAFYRERYLPVKNAFKVYSIYRIGDVGIILAMWASHHLFHENITFYQWLDFAPINEQLTKHSTIGIFIALSLTCAAAVKSAQVPFSSWLPRAMEGPTPSSAIFYGSLSVHLGVFLMLRTFPLWEHQLLIRVAIGMMGLVTSIMASLMSRVQSSIKSQVAYGSIAQIGLIFIEIALGWHYLALFHTAGNAFLRTYQLLASPSVVSYMIKDQFYHFKAKERTVEDTLPRRLEHALYLLALKEFNLELLINFLLWRPLKRIGKSLNFLNVHNLVYFFIPTFLIGIALLVFKTGVPITHRSLMPLLFAAVGVALVFRSFTERKSAELAWLLVIFSHFWIILAVSYNDTVPLREIIIYLSGVVIGGTIGLIALYRLKRVESKTSLNQYLGHVYEHPKFAFLFLLATLGVTGFPITATFVGEDLLFSHIDHHQVGLAFLVASAFVVSGIAGIRIYTRLFLGPHHKTYHATPYPSS